MPHTPPPLRRVLVASPAYLADRGAPADVADLLRHDLIVFDNLAVNGEWRFTTGNPLRAAASDQQR
jgi:hypothetical protein